MCNILTYMITRYDTLCIKGLCVKYIDGYIHDRALHSNRSPIVALTSLKL